MKLRDYGMTGKIGLEKTVIHVEITGDFQDVKNVIQS